MMMKSLVSRVFNRLRPRGAATIPEKTDPNYNIKDRKLIIAYSAGRSGSTWMGHVFLDHQNVAGGVHRRDGFEEFYRYVTWYKLPIDLEGYYLGMQELIDMDWAKSAISLYSSPNLAFGIKEITERFKPDFNFFHIRDPEAAINSFYEKGWYKDPIVKKDLDLINGPQPLSSGFFDHSLGRIMPREDHYEEWINLSRIGKVAWFYVTINQHIYEYFQTMPSSQKWYFKLSDVDQNYDYYQYLVKEFDLKPPMNKEEFLGLKGEMVNIGKSKRLASDWSKKERSDYDKIVGPFLDMYEKIKTTGF